MSMAVDVTEQRNQVKARGKHGNQFLEFGDPACRLSILFNTVFIGGNKKIMSTEKFELRSIQNEPWICARKCRFLMAVFLTFFYFGKMHCTICAQILQE